ncbi:MAG: symmetrical bis(5'-nucleosyl)-tetraphosphatase [Bdellovibrio sp.]|nr:symmetrical bis(5'-nucleosyl)-tetraphosphatase [Methylotenera sp.]
MRIYAIGDIQGCYHAFMALLSRLEFKPTQDKLWLVGDLINRGSGSLEVLRWCYQHQNVIKIVLGNHDLHALAVAYGLKPAHKGDTLQAIIEAPDRAELLTWLRYQPLLLAESGYVMVHAGLLPQWTMAKALSLASEVETALQGASYLDFFANMYGSLPNSWRDDLTGMDRLRVITNAMTRMRICTASGEMEFAFKGELQDIPAGYMPWFDVPTRVSKDATILCGHWSALGLKQRANIIALDTGCLWGGQLTAFCLETKKITQVNHDARDKA